MSSTSLSSVPSVVSLVLWVVCLAHPWVNPSKQMILGHKPNLAITQLFRTSPIRSSQFLFQRSLVLFPSDCEPRTAQTSPGIPAGLKPGQVVMEGWAAKAAEMPLPPPPSRGTRHASVNKSREDGIDH